MSINGAKQFEIAPITTMPAKERVKENVKTEKRRCKLPLPRSLRLRTRRELNQLANTTRPHLHLEKQLASARVYTSSLSPTIISMSWISLPVLTPDQTPQWFALNKMRSLGMPCRAVKMSFRSFHGYVLFTFWRRRSPRSSLHRLETDWHQYGAPARRIRGQDRATGWRIPAACFSRIFCAAASFALASSLPLMPWPFFCTRGNVRQNSWS